MEHSHHDGNDSKKRTAWFSYAAASVLIAGFVIFINCMNCCEKSCENKTQHETHGEHHSEENHSGEHH